MDRVDRAPERPPAAPVAEVGGRVGAAALLPRHPQQQGDDPPQQRAAGVPRLRQDGSPDLAADARRIHHRHRALDGGAHGLRAGVRAQQRSNLPLGLDADGPGQRPGRLACIRLELADHQALGISLGCELRAQGINAVAALGRDDGHARRVDPGGGQAEAEIRGQLLSLLVGQAIRLVEHESHAWRVGRERAEISVEPLVVVLLGVDHPGDGVDPRQELVDA